MNEVREIFGQDGFAHRVAVYVPSTVNVRESAEAQQSVWVDSALAFFSRRFGGASAQTGITGAWESADGSLVKEGVVVVYAFAAAVSREDAVEIKRFALDLKSALSQEAILVEVDGVAFFF